MKESSVIVEILQYINNFIFSIIFSEATGSVFKTSVQLMAQQNDWSGEHSWCTKRFVGILYFADRKNERRYVQRLWLQSHLVLMRKLTAVRRNRRKTNTNKAPQVSQRNQCQGWSRDYMRDANTSASTVTPTVPRWQTEQWSISRNLKFDMVKTPTKKKKKWPAN